MDVSLPLSPEAGVLRLPAPAEMKAARQAFKTKWFDEYTPIQELSKIAPLALEDDPYIAARMYAGHQGKVAAAVHQLREIGMPVKKAGLLDIFNRQLELSRDIELFRRPDLIASRRSGRPRRSRRRPRARSPR